MEQKQHLYNLIKETFIVIDDGDRRLFSRFGLTPPRFYVLFHINEEPGISASDLSQKLLCDKSNVTRIVKGLEQAGHLERRRNENDGRAQHLYLTPSGETLCQEVREAHQLYNTHRLNCLTEQTQTDLLENLTNLHRTLQEALTSQNNMQNGHLLHPKP